MKSCVPFSGARSLITDTCIYSGPAHSGQKHSTTPWLSAKETCFLCLVLVVFGGNDDGWRKDANKYIFSKSVQTRIFIAPYPAATFSASPKDPPSVNGLNLICCSLGRMHSTTSFPRRFRSWYKKLKMSSHLQMNRSRPLKEHPCHCGSQKQPAGAFSHCHCFVVRITRICFSSNAVGQV